MSLFGALQPFDSLKDDFDTWILSYESILVANEIEEKETARRRAILLNFLGLPTLQLLKDLLSPVAPTAKTPKEIIKTLTDHFKPTPKALAERYKFMGRKQAPGESVNSFLADLRKLATNCKFGSELSMRLRDQFTFGINCESTQRTVFTKDDDITLDEVVQIAEAKEIAAASTSLIRGQSASSSRDLEQNVNKTVKFQKKNWKGGKNKNSNPSNNNSKDKNKSDAGCGRCGNRDHYAKTCPNKDKTCNKCGKVGHFANKCRTGESTMNNVEMCAIMDVRNLDDPIRKHHKMITVNVKVDKVSHEIELDTGCETSILSDSFWKNELGAPPLKKSDIKFRTYTKEVFQPLGELETELEYQGQKVKHSFPVFKGSSLFGRDLLNKIKIDWKSIQQQCHSVKTENTLRTVPESATLLTRSAGWDWAGKVSGCDTLKALLNEFRDIFAEPGVRDKIKNFKARVILREEAVPKYLNARPLPFSVKEKVERELELMVKQGVIEKIEYSKWASPLVVVPKANGRVRITGDFKNTVNNQLCITQYPLAIPEDLFAMVSGGVTFSKLDGANAYHQIELEDNCKDFLVINTHKGLFRYNVLPQGIASSPAIFQEFMDIMLRGIEKTGSFIDDLLTTGTSNEVHLQTLRKVFERMREYNYKLSPEKCAFMKESVQFLGHDISANGIKTTIGKVEAILKMQVPKDVSSLRSFLGLVNFYGKFVPNLADICVSLYNLTKQDVIWNWNKSCQDAFEQVKRKLSSSPTLAHFDYSKEIGISCDASSKGLGVVLFPKYKDGTERPIAFASKILSGTEQRYSQIEKEGLSIIYGIKKFYKYLCGRRFLLVTDHKPLITIFGPKSQLPTYAASRLHHWCVYLSQFIFDVIYRKSGEHGNADALSRLPIQVNKINCEKYSDECYYCYGVGVELAIHQTVNETFEVLPVTATHIRQSSSRDKVLSRVIHFIEGGWPNHLNPEDAYLQNYHAKRDELTMQQGIIMWGIRILIPSNLRQKMLDLLHDNHFGMVKMKSIARQYLWWPNIDKDIEELCRSCVQCQSTKADPPSAPLHPWSYPEKAWQRLHMDLAGPFLGKMWLLVIDAHSKWPEVFNMKNDTTTAAIKSKLVEIFGRFGLPDQIVTDNGLQFASEEFSSFCKANAIKNTRSSVYHPRSNGEAERFVRTFKTAMKACTGNPETYLHKFLFQYRATIHSTTGVSPAELLMGRKLKTAFDLIRPDVKGKVLTEQARQEANYNGRVKSRQLQDTQDVWVKTFSKNEEKWSKGKVVRSLGPVTYLIQVGDKQMKRHIDHISDAGPNLSTSSSAHGDLEDSHFTPTANPDSPTTVVVSPTSSSSTPSTMTATPTTAPVSPSETPVQQPQQRDPSPPTPAPPARPRRNVARPLFYGK